MMEKKSQMFAGGETLQFFPNFTELLENDKIVYINGELKE